MSVTGFGEVADLLKAGLQAFIPDKDKVVDAANTLAGRVMDYMTAELQAQRDAIVAEAKGESGLQRNWRPLVMLWFMVLISAYWFGFSVQNLPPEQILELLSIVKIGLGGYVIGRSGEKIATTIAPAIHAALKK